jgi:CTD kinase subunit beta
LLDLLDLYTHYRNHTVVGIQHDLNVFINIKIELNKEALSYRFPRYTEEPPSRPRKTDKYDKNDKNDKNSRNGKKSKNEGSKDASLTGSGAFGETRSPEGDMLLAPSTPLSTTKAGERGREGTVRFMLDAKRARTEERTVDEYFTLVEVDDDEE